MSFERTGAVVARFLDGDHSAVAEDAVFTDMGSGERFEGREAIYSMLERFYRQAFEGKVEDWRRSFGDGFAVTESVFDARHVGEYAGVPATGAHVRIPICAIYRIEDDQIVEGRGYILHDLARRA